MPMDDLYKALGVFQEQTQKLAISKGIQDATMAVDQLNAQTTSALERRKQQTTIANQLALQLTGVGASGQQIQTAMGALMPPAIKDSNDAYQQALLTGDREMAQFSKDLQGHEVANQKMLQDDQQAFLTSEGDKNRANTLAAARVKGDRKLSDKEFEYISSLGKQFEASAKDNINALDRAKTARESLQLALKEGNPTAINAAVQMLVKASGDVGAITESDRKLFTGSKDIYTSLKRFALNKFNGMPPADDIKYLNQVAELFENNQSAFVKSKALQFAKKGANRMPDYTAEDLAPQIWGDYKSSTTKSVADTTPPPAKEWTQEVRKNKATGQNETLWRSPHDGKLYQQRGN